MSRVAFEDRWWLAYCEVIGDGSGRFSATVDDINSAADQMVSLLSDSSALLANGSHATAVFLAITALEEIAKFHIGLFRDPHTRPPRKRDPLFRHARKHLLAAAPTVAMGSRLQNSIGEDRMWQLMEMAAAGKFIEIREAALYLDMSGPAMRTPRENIEWSQARELLLFAIEAFDDALVGYTAHTFELGEHTDQLFDHWKHERAPS